MAIFLTKQDVDFMQTQIIKASCPEPPAGMKVMCIAFPSNGLYVAEGVVRYFYEKNSPVLDMTEYFEEMKMRNYYDLKATLTGMRTAEAIAEGGKK